MRRFVVSGLAILALASCGQPTNQSNSGPIVVGGTPVAGQPASNGPTPCLQNADNRNEPCSGGVVPSTSLCPDIAGPLPAIAFGANYNLAGINPDGSESKPLTTMKDVSVREPAWSPDGQTLAFTLGAPSSDPNLTWLEVGVICGLDRQTGKGRLLAKGALASDSLEEPTWSADGKSLVVTFRAPIMENDQYQGSTSVLTKVDLATQQMQPLVKDASNPALSPDGKLLAYVVIDQTSFLPSLMVAQADGSNAKRIDPQADPFATILAPRWSPDSQRLIFAGSGGPKATVAPTKLALWERLLGIEVAEAHGLPAYLWVIGADGQGIQRLTPKPLDDPRAAWSPDSKQIAYTGGGVGGVILVDIASKQEQNLTKQGDYGGIAWVH